MLGRLLVEIKRASASRIGVLAPLTGAASSVVGLF
jgi:hypothetical protein